MKNLKKIGFTVLLSLVSLSACDYQTINEVAKKATATQKTADTVDKNKIVTPSITPKVPNLIGSFDLKKASEIVTNKCAYCHSIKPNPASGRTKAAAGITFDSPKEIENQMDLIKKVTFVTRSMPIDITITEEERNAIGLFGQTEITSPKFEIKDAPAIITRKCTYCHSATPDPDSGYRRAPENFKIDSLQEMINKAQSIKKETLNKSMPVGKITMTEEERALVGQWADQQTSSIGGANKDDEENDD